MLRPKRWRPSGMDPSPAEIEARAAEIRRSWDLQTLLQRESLVPKRARFGQVLCAPHEVDYGAYDDEWMLLTRDAADPRDGILPRGDLLAGARRLDDDRSALLDGDSDL